MVVPSSPRSADVKYRTLDLGTRLQVWDVTLQDIHLFLVFFPGSSCFPLLGRTLAMPESHLEIAGSAGFSSLPIKWDFLPKRITLKTSALAVNSHVRLKAVDLTPQSKPVWI